MRDNDGKKQSTLEKCSSWTLVWLSASTCCHRHSEENTATMLPSLMQSDWDRNSLITSICIQFFLSTYLQMNKSSGREYEKVYCKILAKALHMCCNSGYLEIFLLMLLSVEWNNGGYSGYVKRKADEILV